MTPLRSVPERLFARLSTSLGRQSALQELKWMREATPGDDELSRMVERRVRGEPLQYILGTQPFGPLELRVRKPVLIPRPETEDWTLHVASLLKPSQNHPIKLLDLCTGTGCIPLLLSHVWPAGSVRSLGVDINCDAISLARENATLVGLSVSHASSSSPSNTFEALEADILGDDFLDVLKRLGWSAVDVLTSNPPYIPLHEYNELPPSVKEHEDIRALLGDPEPSIDTRGLTFYRRIASLVRDGIVDSSGLIALEVGQGQVDDVEQIMRVEGRVRETNVRKDPWGIARTVLCRR